MISNISYVKEILEQYETHAKKKFGQNFLIDSNIVDKIAKCAVEEGGVALEIGPGLGALTEMLLKYADEVYAYEIDRDMYSILQEEFAGEDRLKIQLTDFLDVDLDEVPYKNQPISVCSNLPYYVTTPILFKLFESGLSIRKITVMVQKEVANRFKAPIGSEDYNALSIIVQYLYDVKLEMNISKNVFYPSPNVDSAVVSFVPKKERNRDFESRFFELVKKCFVQRRKTIRNNLKEYFDEEKINQIFNELKIKESARAQELSLDDYLKMYEVVYER